MATLDELKVAIRSVFAQDTCSPDDLPEWSLRNASRGHCAVASLTLYDYLGGQLVCAEVHRDNKCFGYHWWTIIQGRAVDLTLDQFTPEETVGEPWPIERPVGDDHFYGGQHKIFRRRVAQALAAAARTRHRRTDTLHNGESEVA